MKVRTHPVGVPSGIQLNVAAEDVRERARLNEINNAYRAGVVRCRIFHRQAPRHQKIPGKKNARSTIVKCHMRRVVSRRRDHIDGAVAKLYLGDSVRPVGEAKKRTNRLQVRGHNLNRGKASGICAESATAPVSIRSALSDPTSR